LKRQFSLPVLHDFAGMREAVETRGCHLGIHCPAGVLYSKTMRGAKDARPFSERKIGRDDDGCAFVEFTYQMEQELPAGLREGQKAQFVEE